MKLTTTELAYLRMHGLYITEKGDHCGKLLNQTVRYTQRPSSAKRDRNKRKGSELMRLPAEGDPAT